MSPRALTILNAIGCLALTGLVVAQWHKERALNAVLTESRAALAAAQDQAASETTRRAALERDIAVLKESIETTQRAAEAATRSAAEKELAGTQLQAELTAAREQVTTWEAALKSRDDHIRALDANLKETRKRLDDAIAKLKAAGAH